MSAKSHSIMTNSPPSLLALSADAFGAQVEPFRMELRYHCYRMTGSLHQADDLVQDTLLRAWRRRETFSGRGTLRAWLYAVATRICLDALHKQRRRTVPRLYQPAGSLEQPIPPDVHDPIWLEPYPDEWLPADPSTPEAALITRETITLGFITLLQVLPPRQRAVLLLRDALGWSAQGVADALDLSVPAVKSALHRARETLKAKRALTPDVGVVLDPDQLTAYVDAWERADSDALVALLKDDAIFSMPPIPAWYQGGATIRQLTQRTVFAGPARGRWRLIPARANGTQAFGLYRLEPSDGLHHAYGIQVLTAHATGIAEIITFRVPALFERFGLPPIAALATR
jgi:RNA polymerase sigma-70 factor (ECF subfamily)